MVGVICSPGLNRVKVYRCQMKVCLNSNRSLMFFQILIHSLILNFGLITNTMHKKS